MVDFIPLTPCWLGVCVNSKLSSPSSNIVGLISKFHYLNIYGSLLYKGSPQSGKKYANENLRSKLGQYFFDCNTFL